MYKCIKASNVSEDVVQIFESQCKHLQDAGQRVKISIEALNQFAKEYARNEDVNVADLQGTADTDSVVNDTTADDSVAEDTTEDATETTSDTIFTLSFKRDSGNVSVRYSHSEGLVTTNSADEIQMAIAFLTEQL